MTGEARRSIRLWLPQWLAELLWVEEASHFNGFLSYSHADDVDSFSVEIQKTLHRLAKPWYRLRATRVFRDRDHLEVSSHLWPVLEENLKRSEYLIVLASPAAARSRGVEFETEAWVRMRDGRQIRDRTIIVLVRGEMVWREHTLDRVRTNALPEPLCGPLLDEPVVVDLRPARAIADRRSRQRELGRLLAPVAARLRGVPAEWIASEEFRQHRIRRRVVFAVSFLVLALAVGLGREGIEARRQARIAIEQAKIASDNAHKAEDQRATAEKEQHRAEAAGREALARQLAVQASSLLLAKNQHIVGSLLAIESAERMPIEENRTAVATALALTDYPFVRFDHPSAVTALAFSPDGKWLCSASLDKTASIWDAVTGRERASLPHREFVQSVAISRDGTWVATASADHTAGIWDASTGRERARLEHPDIVDAVAISPNGAWLATVSGDKVFIWDAAKGRERSRLQHPAKVSAVAISPDGTWLATSSDGVIRDHTARIWDVATGRERARLPHRDNVNEVAISPDGTWLATTTSFDDAVLVWDVASGLQRARLQHQGTLVISPTGSWFATADGATAHIWDASTYRERINPLLQGDIKLLAPSSDGKWLATASLESSDNITLTPGDNTTVRIWDASTGSEYIRLHLQDEPRVIAFSPGGQLLAVGHGDSITLEPWQIEDLVPALCHQMTRNLTLVEWNEYLGNESYHRTCPNLPGPEASKTAKPK
jgi:WD40 repeat protein